MKAITLLKISSFKVCLVIIFTILMFSSCTKESRTHDKGTFQSTSDLNSVIDLENGLVGYYPFSGNTLDSSGHHNDVIFNNATPTKDRFGNRKGAYLFNGIDN